MDGSLNQNHREETFFLDNFSIDRLFNTIERTDYLFLHYIKDCDARTGHRGRVYLSDLAETMKLKIPELSKAVENLQSKGYVLWQTDMEAGRTYVELTSKAVELMHDEKTRMKLCFQKILAEIEPEQLAQALDTLKKIVGIINSIDAEPEEG